MGLDNDSITERFRELELQRRRIEAEMAAVVAVADARGVYGDDGHRSIKGWMRANANWSGCRRVDRCDGSSRLFESCPSVGDALLAGHIGRAQVDRTGQGAQQPAVRCPARRGARPAARQCRASLVRGLPHRGATVGAPRRRGRHARRRRDESRQPHRRAARGQRLCRPAGEWGRPLDAAEMLGIFERFVEDEFRADVAARTELHGPDAPASLLPRTDAQRRFDALMKIFRTAASMPAGARAPEPVVNIVCDIETFETLLARHRLIPFPDDLPLTDLARSGARPTVASSSHPNMSCRRRCTATCGGSSSTPTVWCSTWDASDACSRVPPGWRPS